MAGESARAYARRQREKGERLIRAAERWERGAAGEVETAARLDALRAQGWVVFHDVRWPGRPRANIDHVAVGPGGVFVIDSKNWSGSIAVRDNVLLQDGRRRESTVAGAGEAALAITSVLGNLPATGVLCFVRDEPLSGWARDVMVCSTATLADLLTSRPPTLHQTAVPRVAGQLSRWLTSADAPARRSAMPAPAPRRTARSSVRPVPTGPTAPRLARRLARLGLTGIALLVLVPLMIHLVTGTARKAVEAVQGPSGLLGEPLVAPGRSGEPALAVTALEVAPTRVSAGVQRPAAGTRLVAIELRISNRGDGGDRGWSMVASGSSLSIQDSAGTTYHPLVPRRPGQGFWSGSALIPPGDLSTGRVVFEVPRRAVVAQVTMTVGPGLPRRLRWYVPA